MEVSDELIDALLLDRTGPRIDLEVLSWRHVLHAASRSMKPHSFNDHRIELVCQRTTTLPEIHFYSEKPVNFRIEIRSIEHSTFNSQDSTWKTTAERVAENGQNPQGVLCYYPPHDLNVAAGKTASECWGYVLFGMDTIISIMTMLNTGFDQDIQLSLSLAASAEGVKVDGFLELRSSGSPDRPRSHHWDRPSPVLIKEAQLIIGQRKEG
jgi:hypothetical protein